MESTIHINNTKSNSLRKVEVHHPSQHVQATPKERLHSVDEFIDKLEEAVLERL